MQIIPIKTRLFKEEESLLDFIHEHVPGIESGDILAVTSKILALSEGRTAPTADLDKIIRSESREVIETEWALLTLGTDGWGINAGVDESNADGKVILLPRDAFLAAESIRRGLMKARSLKSIGVLITDTRSLPLRAGTIGRAIGFAGFKPLKSYVGKEDLFGRKSRVTQSNHADALAAAAVLVMGEGSERIPLAVIRGAPLEFIQGNLTEKERKLDFPSEQDIFASVYLRSQSGNDSDKKKGR